MAASTVEHKMIVPPTYMAQIIGVMYLRIGARKIWAKLQSGAEISVRRKAISGDPEADYISFANAVLTEYRRAA